LLIVTAPKNTASPKDLARKVLKAPFTRLKYFLYLSSPPARLFKRHRGFFQKIYRRWVEKRTSPSNRKWTKPDSCPKLH